MASRHPARDALRRSIWIEDVRPEIDSGRFPVKREVGDPLVVTATVFKEGHDRLAVVAKHRRAGEKSWTETRMELINPGLDLWRATIPLEANSRYGYTIEAWPDAFESWLAEIGKKRGAGQSVPLELTEGRALVAEAAGRARGDDRKRLAAVLAGLDSAADDEARAALLLDAGLRATIARWPDRSLAVRYDRELEVVVDRVRARYGAWYEMFPRSQGTVPGRSATFDDCIARLDEVRDLGFDVVYLVPIHPIGRIHRKGRHNSLTAGPDDPGSPYAIGAAEGGHTAIHPDLGTLDDFRRFVGEAESRGMEIALDFAIQCSPDHPWVKEHPEWFQFRPDGTIKYAENPPKKYEDIVNVDFYCEAREALWDALRDVVLFWIGQGVKIFRVDNPHTKPIPFWEWLIRNVQDEHPDTIFLAEAFTRPPMMHLLAKAGFTQSYTYFTWRNLKAELIEYLTELTATDAAEYMRPNFFANTPDILPPILQQGGRPAFMIRFVLAATLSPTYGIYNGFELCENAAIPGREEYADSEKYAYRVWDWDRPGHIKEWIRAINRIRRDNPALHELDNLQFYPASDDHVLFYGKATPDGGNMIFVAVNVDPFQPYDALLEFPLSEIGVAPGEFFEVENLLTGERLRWEGASHHWWLDPVYNPAAIFRVVRPAPAIAPAAR